jgi:hypothetical protein
MSDIEYTDRLRMSSGINITLLRDLCPTYLTKFLIEGSNDVSTVMNQELFTHVFKLIKSTHRFI